jgi:hypothetical protein
MSKPINRNRGYGFPSFADILQSLRANGFAEVWAFVE